MCTLTSCGSVCHWYLFCSHFFCILRESPEHVLHAYYIFSAFYLEACSYAQIQSLVGSDRVGKGVLNKHLKLFFFFMYQDSSVACPTLSLRGYIASWDHRFLWWSCSLLFTVLFPFSDSLSPECFLGLCLKWELKLQLPNIWRSALQETKANDYN